MFAEQDLNLQGTKFHVGQGQNVRLGSQQGYIRLKTVSDWNSYSKRVTGGSNLVAYNEGDGFYKTQARGVKINGGSLSITNKGKGLEVEFAKQGKVEKDGEVKDAGESDAQALARLENTAGYGYLSDLQAEEGVTLTGKHDSNISYDYNATGLTEEAQMAAGIAIGAMTGGGSFLTSALISTGTQMGIASTNSFIRGGSLSDVIMAGGDRLHSTLDSGGLDKLATQFVVSYVTQGYGSDAMNAVGVSSNIAHAASNAFLSSASANFAWNLASGRRDGYNMVTDAIEVGGVSATLAGLGEAQQSLFQQMGDVNGYQDIDQSITGTPGEAAVGIFGQAVAQTAFDMTNQVIVGHMQGKSSEEINKIINRTATHSFLHNAARNMRKYEVYQSAQSGNLLKCNNSFDGSCIAGIRTTKHADGRITKPEKDAQIHEEKDVIEYNSNGDRLKDIISSRSAEHFAGPHDYFNNPYYYDQQGYNKPNPYWDWGPNAWNLLLAAPFAGASAVDKWFYYNHVAKEK